MLITCSLRQIALGVAKEITIKWEKRENDKCEIVMSTDGYLYHELSFKIDMHPCSILFEFNEL